MGSPLRSESLGSNQPQTFDLRYSPNPREKHTATSDLHNTVSTCRVSPGSCRRQIGSTAPRGSPWIPRDIPGQSQQGEMVSADRQTSTPSDTFERHVTHLDVARTVGLFWTHTAVTSVGPKGEENHLCGPVIELKTSLIKTSLRKYSVKTLFLS